MRIDFTQLERTETDTARYNKIANYTAPEQNKSIKGDGYRLDISGTVMDNTAFDFSGSKGAGKKGQGKTLEESLRDVDNYDPQTMHNYMAVMSNCMSAQDFSELQKDGYSIGQMDPKEAVTNLDRIKVTLAKAGVNVAGYTDTVDSETVRQIAGSAGEANRINAQNSQVGGGEFIKDSFEQADLPATEENIQAAEKALAKASEISPLSDNTVRYMIDNGLEPTIESVYEAQFKSGTGSLRQSAYFADNADGSYIQKKADNSDILKLGEQIDEVIEEAGYEADAGMREDAAWLIEKGLPLTKENLQLYEDIRSISFPVDRAELMTEITEAVSRGKAADDAYLIRNYNAVKAERRLEETRLAMTTEANRLLNESDFSIDTGAMEDNVEALRSKEKLFYNVIFGGNTQSSMSVDDMASLFDETLQKVEEIRTMPAAVMGSFTSAEDFTVNDVYEAGTALASRMNLATQTYEAVGTQVRSDLGDFITKAFSNVDDILKDLGLDRTYDNQRAVRILGYNSMELTEENIDRVKAADIEVRNLINKMSPSNTALLIKNNINPLDTDVRTLSGRIDELNNGDELNLSLKKTDKFAEYLIRMEKSGEFTEEERASYIGIYRLFDKIERSDGAVIGSLLEAGKELSLKNLLSEVRTRKKGSIDINVDDDFGGLESKEGNLRIDSQIDMAFKRVYLEDEAAEISENLDPQVLKRAGVNEETTLDELADIIREGAKSQADISAELYAEASEEARLASRAETAVYEALVNNAQPVTMDNVNALASIFENRNALFNDIKDLDEADEDGDGDLQEEAGNVLESMNSREETAEAYNVLTAKAADILDEALDRVGGRIDVQAIRAMNKRLSLIRGLSNEENYYIPVEIDGELTSVNLKVIRGTGRTGASVTMETDTLGRFEASFSLKDDKVEGILSASTRYGTELMKNAAQSLAADLRSEGIESNGFSAVRVMNLNINKIAGNAGNSGTDAEDTTKLYKAAKVFIKTVRRLAMEEN